MKRSLGSHFALLTVLGLGSVLLPATAQATSPFGQAEIADYQSRFAIIASPIGTTGSYKLIIFEQLNNRRQCWQDVGSNPTVIDPLFMQFDFTGICGRSTDSNAYSVRVAGQDLAGRYNLRLVKKANELVLIAFSLTDKNLGFFEIGRTRGLADGYLKIELDPGWRLARRTFQGKSVGHIYLATDRTLMDIAQNATPASSESALPAPQPSVAPAPVMPAPAQPTLPPPNIVPAPVTAPSGATQSSAPVAAPTPSGGYVVPTVTAPTYTPPSMSAPPNLDSSAGTKSLPANWAPRPQSSVIVPVVGTPSVPMMPVSPVSQPTTPTNSGFRVIVAQANPVQQSQIRQLVPGAFRTVVNGQPVIQVGVFRDRAIAQSLQQQLASQGVTAQVVPTTVAIAPAPQPSRPAASVPSLQPIAGSGFSLPEPPQTTLSQPRTLWSTYYYTHRAVAVAPSTDPLAPTYPLLDTAGNSLGISLTHRDWCAAALQGSVLVTNGQQAIGTYNFAGRGEKTQVDCTAFYPRLATVSATNRVRFKPSNTVFGEGVQGNSLVPYRTIAVDRSQIAIGSVLYIPEARGTLITLPSGQQVVHDGYFYAADTGAAIRDNHIDVFIGIADRNPFRFVKSNASGTFTAYVVNAPEIQAMLAAQHQSGRVASR